MFGPMRITHNGQSFYSNVVLVEHHCFERDDVVYVYNVQRLTTQVLGPGLRPLLAQIAGNPGTLVGEAAITALRALSLVVERVTPPAGNGGEIAASAVSAVPEPRPVTSIALFVAQTCNMRCTYCYGEGGEYSEPGMMEAKTAFAAVDWLIVNSLSAPEIQIGYFGGEPLLNFKLMEKVSIYARERAAAAGKRVTFSMTTNGTVMTDRILDFLVAEGINPLVSHDGPAEIQNRQRPLASGAGSHARITANLARLRTAFPRMRGRATLTADGDPYAVQKGLEDAGFSSCIIAKASPVLADTARSQPVRGDEAARSDRMIAFTRQKIERIYEAVKQRAIPEGNPPSLLADLTRMARGNRKLHACGVGKDMAGVSATGDIYPCHRFVGLKDMRLGHVGDTPGRSAAAPYQATVDASPVCRGCWARYVCGGGCMYENKAMTGDLRRPDAGECREKLAGYEDVASVFARLDADDWAYIEAVAGRANRSVAGLEPVPVA